MARTIGVSGKLKVAITDDSGLIYSDDYRQGWLRGFQALGVDVEVFDVQILRRRYSNSRSPYRSTMLPGTGKGIAQRIIQWGAHVVFCHHGRAGSEQGFQTTLKRAGVKTAVYLCDEPYECGETAKYSPGFTHVFTMDPCTVELHRKARQRRENVFYLPPGVDTAHFAYKPYFTKAGNLLRDTPAFFLGNATLIPRNRWLKPINKLVEGADIRFFGVVGKNHPKWVPIEKHPQLYSSCIVGLNVHRSPVITRECFRKRVHGRPPQTVPQGMELCPKMPQHEGTGFWNDPNLPAAHINPRFLEMAACGTLVVNDNHRSELARLFPMAPQAESPEHFYELVQHYINHPEEAEAIGQACSELISRRHTYAHRAAEVLIRLGFKDCVEESRLSSLGVPEDWLTPQDCGPHGIESFSARTGPSERWSPRFGMSLTRTSGRVSDSTSLDAPIPWL